MMRLMTAALFALALGGCREGVPPFIPSERVVEGTSYALTFGYGQDADPRWSTNGDTVLYHTTMFGSLPHALGALLSVDRSGGAAVPVFEDIQLMRPMLATPAVSPQGDRIAYFDLMSVDAPDACFRVERDAQGEELLPHCAPLQPLLDSAMLRVRAVGERGPLSLDPAVSVKFDGTDPNHRFRTSGPWYERFQPFQIAYSVEHAMVFRPAWAPDGERIAFSDGLRLHVWRVGDPLATVVPGTEDGVSAAWSPDGEWIAFTHLARVDSITYECACPIGRPPIVAFRTVYTVGTPRVVLVRPDGSERIELGEGEDPAWSPDGEFIYARRGIEIVRMPGTGGAATPIANTTGGRSPAVSPDGAWLAFSRLKPQLIVDYDIWVVSLEQ